MVGWGWCGYFEINSISALIKVGVEAGAELGNYIKGDQCQNLSGLGFQITSVFGQGRGRGKEQTEPKISAEIWLWLG